MVDMVDKMRTGGKSGSHEECQTLHSQDDYFPGDRKVLQKVQQIKKQHFNNVVEGNDVFPSNINFQTDNFHIAYGYKKNQVRSEDHQFLKPEMCGENHWFSSTDRTYMDYSGCFTEQDAILIEEISTKKVERLCQNLVNDNLSHEIFIKAPQVALGKESLISSDPGQHSNSHNTQLLEIESSEFAGLINDFKSKLTVTKEDLKPVLNLVKDGNLPDCPGSSFVKSNYKMLLDYSTNINLYLQLKMEKDHFQNHTVVNRLYRYREMLNEMEPIYVNVIKPHIDSIKTVMNNDVNLLIVNGPSESRKRRSDSTFQTSKKMKLLKSVKQDEGEDTGVSDNEDDDEWYDFLLKKSEVKSNYESEESGFSDYDEDCEEIN